VVFFFVFFLILSFFSSSIIRAFFLYCTSSFHSSAWLCREHPLFEAFSNLFIRSLKRRISGAQINYFRTSSLFPVVLVSYCHFLLFLLCISYLSPFAFLGGSTLRSRFLVPCFVVRCFPFNFRLFTHDAFYGISSHSYVAVEDFRWLSRCLWFI
jgi:hypothetical protein